MAKHKSKHRRKDVIIARIIFALMVLALAALITFAVRYVMGKVAENQPEQNTETQQETSEDGGFIFVEPPESQIETESEPSQTQEVGSETTETQPADSEPVDSEPVDSEPIDGGAEGQESTNSQNPEEQTPSSETSSESLYYAKYRVNLRVEPNTESGIYLTIPVGEAVTLISKEEDGWAKVEYAGYTGYVVLKYFTREAPLLTGRVVVLDPGHQKEGDSQTEPNGPNSSVMKARVSQGTTGVVTGIAEYELTLDIAKAVKTVLVERGYTVFLTRETHDVNMSNMERALFATDVDADITVRLHANGAENTAASGALVLAPSTDNSYVGKYAADSHLLGERIMEAYCEATGLKNYGVMNSDTMTGINWSTMPVVILEMGYMSNESDDRQMADSSFREKMVLGIANGIDRYFGV